MLATAPLIVNCSVTLGRPEAAVPPARAVIWAGPFPRVFVRFVFFSFILCNSFLASEQQQ
jgi:hypothetical protein